jgi:xylulokinase
LSALEARKALFMEKYLLGIDIGTTATKGILLHPVRGIVAEAEAPAQLISRKAGWAEENPEEWWANVGEVARSCLRKAGIGGKEVGGVGVSGMVPTLILLDRSGKVLRPSIQQNDARSFEEIQEFRRRADESDVLQQTGSAITQQSIGPKLLWLRRHEPEAMARAVHLMGSYDFIVYKLTGSFSCERNWALESGLFDLHRQDWDESLLTLSTSTRDWLGKVRWPSEVAGEMTADAARHTGLPGGTPVVAGSADHIASAFSAGVKSPGDLLVKLGGAGDILYDLDRLVVDPRLFLDYHVIPGKYLINGCMAASGSIVKWFRTHLAPESDYPALDAEGSSIPCGSEGLILLPYFLGEKTPINDPLARGVLFGLTLSHTRGHIYRSILEGIAYGFRHHLAVLAERNLRAQKARVTNGGARSALWKKVTADVLGIPLEEVADHPGSSLGAAFVAGMGTGQFKGWEEIERFIRVSSVVRPDPKAQERYGELFAIYRGLYDSLKEKFPVLHRATRGEA